MELFRRQKDGTRSAEPAWLEESLSVLVQSCVNCQSLFPCLSCKADISIYGRWFKVNEKREEEVGGGTRERGSHRINYFDPSAPKIGGSYQLQISRSGTSCKPPKTQPSNATCHSSYHYNSIPLSPYLSFNTAHLGRASRTLAERARHPHARTSYQLAVPPDSPVTVCFLRRLFKVRPLPEQFPA